jgi:hypothetical protein
MGTDHGTHDIEMGIINRVVFLSCGRDDPERLGVDHFMTPISRFSDFAHSNAPVHTGDAHA